MRTDGHRQEWIQLSAGATHDVIDRGNYRSWIFQHAKTRTTFQTTLFEACERTQRGSLAMVARDAFIQVRRYSVALLGKTLDRKIFRTGSRHA